MACAPPKRALPITQAPRFGKGKSMGASAISGPLDVFYMKCALCILPSERKIFQDFIEKLS